MSVSMPQERGTSSNRFTILGRLATGGMADIYLALVQTEAGVDRHLVLKRVLAERARDPLFSQMFLDEARLAAQLQHPNIAQVYDVGKLEGAYFFTMEYVHGEDVRGVLYKLAKLKKQIPENLALHVAAGALAALHYAHERTTKDGQPLGVVHRDVSPSNIMISLDGQVKLLDFGVAKASQRSSETRSGAIKGKVAYLSPEQIASTSVDRRTDIYALGIVLWEMLTGQRLYRRDTDFATMMAITQEAVPPPSSKRPGLSPEIDRLVMTALEKDVAKRYQSADAMLEDLEAIASAGRLLLSSNAMGRFMKDLFGSKVEPWLELEQREDIPSPVTITGESLSMVAEGTVELEVETNASRTQLAMIPDIRIPAGPRSEELAAVTPMPTGAGVWGEKTPTSSADVVAAARRSAPMPAQGDGADRAVEPAGAPARAAAGGAAAELPGSSTSRPSSTGAVPPAPRRWPLVAGGLAVVAVVAAVAFQLLGAGERDGGPATTSRADRPAVVAALDAGANVVASGPAAPLVDAGVAAASGDAAVAGAGAAAGSAAALERCSEAGADVVACGVAACEAKARAKAAGFLRRASRGEQIVIEAACKQAGITLARPAAPAATAVQPTPVKPRPPADPCKDPAYVEANPLKCQ